MAQYGSSLNYCVRILRFPDNLPSSRSNFSATHVHSFCYPVCGSLQPTRHANFPTGFAFVISVLSLPGVVLVIAEALFFYSPVLLLSVAFVFLIVQVEPGV